MAWKQLSVITAQTSAANIAELFSNFGAVSVTYMDAADHPIYEPKPGTTEIWQHTKIIGLFEMDSHPEIIEPLLSSQLAHLTLQDWHLETLEDQIWERTWLEHYQPMLFADKLWVCPTGMEKHQSGKTCLTLDPGLAFGTGTHATTALCLEWLASNDQRGNTIIDYGCGSGILAIAALLLGAEHADAIDIDPQALTATLANADKNQVQNRVDCHLPEHFNAKTAHTVLANILATPLIEMAQLLTSLVQPKGHIVLSGILYEQADSVISAYQNFFNLAPPIQQGDWVRIDGIKI